MGYRNARRIHVLLMSWLTLVLVTAWLPMLRGAMDGPSYEWGAGLLGDKAHSVIFDNSKIKRFVPGFECTIPFARGAEEIVDFYAKNPDFEAFNPVVDQLIERLTQQYKV